MGPNKQSLIHKSQRLTVDRQLNKSDKKAHQQNQSAVEHASPMKWRKSFMKVSKRRVAGTAKGVVRKSDASRKGKTVIKASASMSLASAARSTKAHVRLYRTPTKRRPDTAVLRVDPANESYYLQRSAEK